MDEARRIASNIAKLPTTAVRSCLRHSHSMKVVSVIALALALMGCTITPEAIIGIVAGETAGAFIAGRAIGMRSTQNVTINKC